MAAWTVGTKADLMADMKAVSLADAMVAWMVDLRVVLKAGRWVGRSVVY